MKKVLIIVNHDIVIYNFRKELVQRLIDENYEVHILSPMGDKIPKLQAMGAYHIENVIDRKTTNPFKDLKLLKSYKRVMKDLRPDVVLTYTIKPNIYGGFAAKALKIPYIANITGLGSALENKGILQLITTKLYRRAFKKVSVVFFQNTENRQFFINKRIANKDTYRLIPGSGVNLEEFPYTPYSQDETIKFVYIARVMKEKGIDLYLDAASHYKDNKKVEFHICGFLEEDYLDRLKSLSEQNVIIYHGMVNDIREVIKDMHATIHPSYYAEGMSNALLESASMGKPVFGSDRSGIKEIICDEVTGYTFEPKNTEMLIEKIDKFLNLSFNKKEKMGRLGRIKMEKDFDREIVVKSYLDEIRKLEV